MRCFIAFISIVYRFLRFLQHLITGTFCVLLFSFSVFPPFISLFLFPSLSLSSLFPCSFSLHLSLSLGIVPFGPFSLLRCFCRARSIYFPNSPAQLLFFCYPKFTIYRAVSPNQPSSQRNWKNLKKSRWANLTFITAVVSFWHDVGISDVSLAASARADQIGRIAIYWLGFITWSE